MAYLYETHIHTKEGSACGISRGREYIKKYQDLGYSGIIITDHFIGGNCAIDRHLPWEKFVANFCRGYENAREEGARAGFDVFFGWEQTYDGDDYLVYGLDKEWLLEHPEVVRWSRKEQFEEARRYGGCVVQAHPFRQYYYIDCIRLSACVDAVEVANSGNEQSFDAFAWAYSNKLKVSATAGSDIHSASDIRSNTVFGVYLDKKMENILDYVNAVRNNTISGLKVPKGRFNFYGDERLSLPVEIRDCNDRKFAKSLEEFFQE